MAKTPIELANKFNKPAPKGLGYDFRDRKASTANHNKIIDEINSKYGNDKLSKKEYWDAIDREVDRWNNEQQYWYENEDTPYDKDVANQQAERRKEERDMSDYDLFNSIHYSPSKYGRDNYTEGEEEGIWKNLNLYFDLPKYEPNKYSFLVNDNDKTVSLSTRGELDGGGFGGYKVKPQDLGFLKRRSL